MKVQADTTVARNEAILFSDLDDKLVMMSIDNGEYYSIDAVGKRVWSLLEEPRTVESLCDSLRSEFEVDKQTCGQDVLSFINEMHTLNVVKTL